MVRSSKRWLFFQFSTLARVLAFGVFAQVRDMADGQLIAVRAEARHHPGRRQRDVGGMSKSFAAMHVGNMHLDDRAGAGVERVQNGNRGVGKRARVDDDCDRAFARFVNPIDQLEFGVALLELDGEPEFGSQPPAIRLDVGKGLTPVNMRFTGAEQIQIRSVEDKDGIAHAAHSAFRISNVEKDRLALSLQIDIEAIDDLLIAYLPLAHQGLSPRCRLDDVEHGIGCIGRFLVGEVHACAKPDVDAPRHDPQVDVWGHGTMATATDDRTGLDGAKAIAAAFEVTARASPATKFVVHRLVLPIGGVIVATGGVGLPKLDQCIPEWGACPIEDPPLDADTLAFGLWSDHRLTQVIGEDLKSGLARQETDVDIGTGRLRGGLLQVVERLYHRLVSLQFVLKQRGAPAAQNDIEAMGQRVEWYAGVEIERCNKPARRLPVRDRPEHGIVRQ